MRKSLLMLILSVFCFNAFGQVVSVYDNLGCNNKEYSYWMSIAPVYGIYSWTVPTLGTSLVLSGYYPVFTSIGVYGYAKYNDVMSNGINTFVFSVEVSASHTQTFYYAAGLSNGTAPYQSGYTCVPNSDPTIQAKSFCYKVTQNIIGNVKMTANDKSISFDFIN